MNHRSRPLGLFLGIAIFCFAADLGSKYGVFAWIKSHGPIVFSPDYFQFDAKLNQGGMWSIGHDMGARSNTMLALFSGLVASAIAIWAITGLRHGDRALAVVLGMILGGALGNLYDRIVFDGVRDFIEVHFRDVYYYPTFNVADSCLVCGAIYMVGASLFKKPQTDPVALPADSLAPPAG